MKLVLYKFTSHYLNKVEIYVFDDDLVDIVCNEIKDTFESLGMEQSTYHISYNYCLNFGTPRIISIETSFDCGEFDEPMVWKQVEKDLLKYDDVVLKENDIVCF